MGKGNRLRTIIPQHDEQTYTAEWRWNHLTAMLTLGEKLEYSYNVGGLLYSMQGKKRGRSLTILNYEAG